MRTTTYLEDSRFLNDFPQNREKGMEREGNQNGNRITVKEQGHGNRVDENWDQDSSARTSDDHVHKLEGKWSISANGLEDLASYNPKKGDM